MNKKYHTKNGTHDKVLWIHHTKIEFNIHHIVITATKRWEYPHINWIKLECDENEPESEYKSERAARLPQPFKLS